MTLEEAFNALNAQLIQINTELNSTNLKIDNVNNNITTIISQINLLNKDLSAGFVNLSQGLNTLITLVDFSNQVLIHQTKQNDTIICNLSEISKNTCSILNESHIQTKTQKDILDNIEKLRKMYEITNADSALELKNLDELQTRIEKCCPKPPEPIVCQPVKCELNSKLGEKPKPNFKPLKPRE